MLNVDSNFVTVTPCKRITMKIIARNRIKIRTRTVDDDWYNNIEEITDSTNNSIQQSYLNNTVISDM